jgi:acetylglutamate kinase
VNGPLVLKLGGELIETPADRSRVASLVASIASHRPVLVVHGGGRAIDAELQRRGISPHKVDGLRVTDAPTLEAVIAVLAGVANTELVAAFVALEVPAVGLTGVDAGLGRAARVNAHVTTTGAIVVLGLVGDPIGPDTSLIELMLVHGYVPVIASLGVDIGDRGRVLNVNADVMACRLAAGLGAELVIAGTTEGVLDEKGNSIASLDIGALDAMIGSGVATAGMIAKLSACKAAPADGVTSVRIVDGRGLGSDYGIDDAPGTTITHTHEIHPAG